MAKHTGPDDGIVLERAHSLANDALIAATLVAAILVVGFMADPTWPRMWNGRSAGVADAVITSPWVQPGPATP